MQIEARSFDTAPNKKAASISTTSGLYRTAPIRVALNALTDLVPCYGSRVYLIALARELSKLPQVELLLVVGYRQTRCLPPDLQRFALEVPIPTSRSYWQLLLHYRIRKLLKQANVEVWHLPNTLPLMGTQVSTVITIHDLADLHVPKYGKLRTLYRRGLNFVGAHLADRVLTVSENSKRDLVHLLGVPAEKITVVSLGVGDMFRPLDQITCRNYLYLKYSITGKFILAPGGLSRNKNIHGLLSAFADLCQFELSYLLVLTGEVSQHERLVIQDEIERLTLGGKVLMTGHVPSDDMPTFYNACSAVVYVSLYEGFGLPILEAMACGVPVVASATSSLPEVAGDAAVLVDPYDPSAIAAALKRVLNDRDLQQCLISRGRDRAQTFTWQRTAAQTLDTYLLTLRETEPIRTRASHRRK